MAFGHNGKTRPAYLPSYIDIGKTGWIDDSRAMDYTDTELEQKKDRIGWIIFKPFILRLIALLYRARNKINRYYDKYKPSNESLEYLLKHTMNVFALLCLVLPFLPSSWNVFLPSAQQLSSNIFYGIYLAGILSFAVFSLVHKTVNFLCDVMDRLFAQQVDKQLTRKFPDIRKVISLFRISPDFKKYLNYHTELSRPILRFHAYYQVDVDALIELDEHLPLNQYVAKKDEELRASAAQAALAEEGTGFEWFGQEFLYYDNPLVAVLLHSGHIDLVKHVIKKYNPSILGQFYLDEVDLKTGEAYWSPVLNILQIAIILANKKVITSDVFQILINKMKELREEEIVKLFEFVGVRLRDKHSGSSREAKRAIELATDKISTLSAHTLTDHILSDENIRILIQLMPEQVVNGTFVTELDYITKAHLSPVLIAASNGHLGLCSALIDRGGQLAVSEGEREGYTILHAIAHSFSRGRYTDERLQPIKDLIVKLRPTFGTYILSSYDLIRVTTYLRSEEITIKITPLHAWLATLASYEYRFHSNIPNVNRFKLFGFLKETLTSILDASNCRENLELFNGVLNYYFSKTSYRLSFRYNILKELIEKGGFGEFDNPLNYALMNAQKEMVNELLGNYPDMPHTLSNFSGYSSFHVALLGLSSGHERIRETSREYLDRMLADETNLRAMYTLQSSKDGNTPAHIAASYDRYNYDYFINFNAIDHNTQDVLVYNSNNICVLDLLLINQNPSSFVSHTDNMFSDQGEDKFFRYPVCALVLRKDTEVLDTQLQQFPESLSRAMFIEMFKLIVRNSYDSLTRGEAELSFTEFNIESAHDKSRLKIVLKHALNNLESRKNFENILLTLKENPGALKFAATYLKNADSDLFNEIIEKPCMDNEDYLEVKQALTEQRAITDELLTNIKSSDLEIRKSAVIQAVKELRNDIILSVIKSDENFLQEKFGVEENTLMHYVAMYGDLAMYNAIIDLIKQNVLNRDLSQTNPGHDEDGEEVKEQEEDEVVAQEEVNLTARDIIEGILHAENSAKKTFFEVAVESGSTELLIKTSKKCNKDGIGLKISTFLQNVAEGSAAHTAAQAFFAYMLDESSTIASLVSDGKDIEDGVEAEDGVEESKEAVAEDQESKRKRMLAAALRRAEQTEEGDHFEEDVLKNGKVYVPQSSGAGAGAGSGGGSVDVDESIHSPTIPRSPSPSK